MPKEKKELISVKVSRDTHQYVMRVKGYLEAKHGEQFSFDDTIQELLKYVPAYSMTVDVPKAKPL